MLSFHLVVLTKLSKLYISSIQPRSLFIFSAKVITPQSCGEHQKQCMNSLQASLNEKEIQWPCKKKKKMCIIDSKFSLLSLTRKFLVNWSTKDQICTVFDTTNKRCFVSIHALNYIGALQITCPLLFGCWVMRHVIFLMLRRKELLAKLSKFTKWQPFLFCDSFNNIYTFSWRNKNGWHQD